MSAEIQLVEGQVLAVDSNGDIRRLKCDTDGYLVTTSLGGNTTLSSKGYSSSDVVTRPANTTVYTAGDVVGEDPAYVMEFNNVSETAGAEIKITEGSLMINVAAVPSGMTGFRLHLYNAEPTGITDNTAFNLPSGDRAKYCGYIQFDVYSEGTTIYTTPSDFGDTLFYQTDALSKRVKLATGSTTLYGVMQTIGAYTPTSAAVKTITLYTEEV